MYDIDNKMDEDEFEAFIKAKSEEDKDNFLSSLETASSKGSTEFSVLNLGNKAKENRNRKKPKDDDDTGMNLPEDFDVSDKIELSEEAWERMKDEFGIYDPIDDIVAGERYKYKGKNYQDEYEQKFAKELALYYNLLAQVENNSKIIESKIKGRNKNAKSPNGISKYDLDLFEAATSNQSTKLSIIKELVNVKKTAAELRLKEEKLNPKVDGEDNETVADQFYKAMIGGGRNNFLQAASGNSGIHTVTPESDEIDMSSFSQRFNPTQIAMGYDMDEEQQEEYDVPNAIKYENSNVQIYVMRYRDGGMEFRAIDENDNFVDDYELPEDYLLDSMQFRPNSNYAFDEYGRKYKIKFVDSDFDDKYSDDDGDLYDMDAEDED